MGVFGKNSTPPNKPKRNTFDLSFQNNLTMDYGVLYPFMVEPVIPGDSCHIDTAFGIRAMPTAFPVQTKLRADVHYFYVRNRNLWKDWQNFIGKTGNPSAFPTIDIEGDTLKSCSIHDYLGVPTTSVDSIVDDELDTDTFNDTIISTGYGIPDSTDYVPGRFYAQGFTSFQDDTRDITFRATYVSSTPNIFKDKFIRLVVGVASPIVPNLMRAFMASSAKTGFVAATSITLSGNNYIVDFNTSDIASASSGNTTYTFVLTSRSPQADRLFEDYTFNTPVVVFQNYGEVIDVEHISTPQVLSVNALPYRAYEAIYNSFYRDQRNNPYVLNGVADPNVYIPSNDGGVDTNNYVLHHRNWEQDMFTSAVPSPQQGVAPLVGVSSTGTATFAYEGQNYSVQLETDAKDNITGVSYTESVPNAVQRSIVNVATSGFSINDLRGVNSLQKWLEINMRRGLKYKDQILSHFGVNTSFAELDMPEFLGGTTQMFDSSQVNQTSPYDSQDTQTNGLANVLGGYAGQLSAVGGNKHSINRYFDEHGYIIGIISISPIPAYSQIIRKDWLKRDTLDFYFPEFGHLGFQPISALEVGGWNAIQSNSQDLTFGYQRAWYDYLQHLDEVHGLFRTNLRDFVIARTFANVPSLTEDFLTIDSDDINNVFTVEPSSGVNQPFLGQIHIKNIMKRPIPRYGIPKLD